MNRLIYDELWIIFILALFISMAFTPIAIKVAYRIGAIDVPKDGRRMHTRAMPRFGGMAIFIGTMGSMADYIDEVKESVRKLTDMQHNVIVTMADIIESRDENTGGHIKRTAVYVRLIADKLKEKGLFPEILTEEYIENMSVAAPLHDMGKIHVPDSILNKKGRLTDEEFSIMKTHTGVGKELLEQASEQIGTFDYLEIALQMADSHHEWWNGNGYPHHLVGEEIPLCARIMAVADVFDALVSKRCYKDGMPLEKALSIIKEETGTHFDPVVSEAFLECIEDVKKVLEEQN